jgi:hypothetical protein
MENPIESDDIADLARDFLFHENEFLPGCDQNVMKSTVGTKIRIQES